MRYTRLTKALILTTVALVLGAVLLFPLGCSRILPTAPIDDPVQAFRAEELWPAPPANLAGWLQTCSAEGSRQFERKGGKLTLKADCFKKLEFKVPKDALSDTALISVRVSLFNYYRDGEMEKGYFVEFGPDGLVFAKPAELKMEIRELEAGDGEVLRLYWQNPSSGLWEVEQAVEITGNKKKVKFDIYHFSRYAISQ